MKSFESRRAFTLMEMLVVIAIIIIIVGLITPSLMKALDNARKAKCAANMASIYRAYQMRRADEQKNYKWIPIRTSGWAGILLSYVDGKEKIFRCPMDRTGHWGGIDAMVPAEHCSNNGPGNGVYGTTPLESGQNLGSLFVEYYGPGGLGTVGFAGATQSYKSFSYCIGVPGSASWNVGVVAGYVSTIDDPGVEFKVLKASKMLQVEKRNLGAQGYMFLLNGQGKLNSQIAFTNISSLAVGTQIKVDMVDYCSYGMNDYDIQGPGWGLPPGPTWWMQETYSFFWPVVPAGRILLMDYTNAQIAASRMMTDPTIRWGTSVASFRRHTTRTKSNVLFADGTVQLLDPATIDPGVSTNYATWWQPEPP